MYKLEEECLQILNEGMFEITSFGPLHQPIQQFSIRRDEKLRLILVTDAARGATSSATILPPGTTLVNTDRVLLKSIGGIEGEFIGVIPVKTSMKYGSHIEYQLKEESWIKIAKTQDPLSNPAAYSIDWLENLPASPFVWPATTRVVSKTKSIRTIALDGGITILEENEQGSGTQNAAKLTVDGITFYVCALGLGRDDQIRGIKPGCILYDGTPNDKFRKKVRVALSFTLGLYLVDLGTTHYDSEWHIVATLARSAYSLGQRAFEMHAEQPAPLGPRFLNELNPDQLTRAVAAFMTAFDELDLANLSWAYWHACAATLHIAPAHFGAAIEGLQRAYAKLHPNAVQDHFLSCEQWKKLRGIMKAAVDVAEIPALTKTALKNKLCTLNKVDQRERLKALMQALNLDYGDDEEAAWKRRNKAAHGTPIAEGQEIAAIRDMKLLKCLFQRLLLRITNAADQYIDYTSPNHDYRDLKAAPPNI